MEPLSIAVAVAAAIILLTGVTEGGGDVLGLAADPTLLGIGAIGLMLVLTTFRSPLISPFLRVFSAIFAVEYIVTGLAYVAARAGWWPASLSEAAPPASLPTTLAIFGLLVFLISSIPVVRQITRLADPYFVTNDRRDLQIGGLSAHHVSERRFASSLIIALVVTTSFRSRSTSA
jgi:putative ATP-binding cassette transporter